MILRRLWSEFLEWVPVISLILLLYSLTDAPTTLACVFFAGFRALALTDDALTDEVTQS